MTIIHLQEHETSENSFDLTDEDLVYINAENEKPDARYKRDLKKLEYTSQGSGKYKITAKNHVGSISLPSGLVVTIKPKFKDAWHNLFALFDYTNNINADTGNRSVQAEEGESLWDIFSKMFVAQATQLLKTGLYKTYISKTENITSIKGRLLIVENLKQMSQQKFLTKHWCEFDELSFDIRENQYVLYCTSILIRYVTRNDIKQDLVRIRNIFLSQDVTLKTRFTLSDAKQIIEHRMNKKYHLIFQYCKLILQSLAYQKFIDTTGLAIPAFTINMWELFEDFTTQVLQEREWNKPTQVLAQNKNKHILIPLPNYPNRKTYPHSLPNLKPDNILIRDDDTKLIIDTKYKPKIGSSDWYQATTYSLAKKCDTILLLPKKSDEYSDGFQIPTEFVDEELTIHVKTIDFEEASKSPNFIESLKDQIHAVVDSVTFKK